MQNTRRGFRSVVFDLFGTTVSRPCLEQASNTSQKAIAVSNGEEIDLVTHYLEAIARELKQRQESVESLRCALLALPSKAKGGSLACK